MADIMFVINLWLAADPICHVTAARWRHLGQQRERETPCNGVWRQVALWFRQTYDKMAVVFLKLERKLTFITGIIWW